MNRRPLSAALAVASALAGLAGPAGAADTPDPVLRLSTWLGQLPLDRAPGTPPPDAEVLNWLPGSPVCQTPGQAPWGHLTVGDAVARTLCASPALRQALANVSEQTAGVDLAEVEFRPRWSVSAGYSADRNFNASGSLGRTFDATVGLSWVLFDFGQRSAALREARAGLSAALAQQGNTLLDTLRETLRLYGEAVIAAASLDATREAEATASRTAAAADARHRAEVGSQIERLQAQTALAQATLERVRAEGTWENARAALALALGAEPAQPLQLADWEALVQTSQAAPDLAVLGQEVRQTHPRLQALRAQIDGADARIEAARAQTRGSVTTGVAAGTSRNWGSAGTGTLPAGSAQIRLNIPLFDGRESNALQTQAVARKTQAEAELETARRDVESQLWQAFQALQTGRQSLSASERLLQSAQATHQVAHGRYQAGVGSVLDLLNAQAALAEARRQRVTAQVELLNARLGLSLASGRLGAR